MIVFDSMKVKGAAQHFGFMFLRRVFCGYANALQ